MSDETKNEPDEAEYRGPVQRTKIAKIVFGAFALWGVAGIIIGLCYVAWSLFRDISRAIATSDWSWWTWPRVLLALSVPLGIAILVVNRVRAARRDSGGGNSSANR